MAKTDLTNQRQVFVEEYVRSGDHLEAGIIGGTTFDEGIRALYRTTEQDGVFCYTFFKAIGTKR